MKRKIIAYKNYYKNFFDSLDKATQEKALYGMLLLKTQERPPSKFVKSIRDRLFELRIEWQGNIYRIFSVLTKEISLCFSTHFRKKRRKLLIKRLIKH